MKSLLIRAEEHFFLTLSILIVTGCTDSSDSTDTSPDFPLWENLMPSSVSEVDTSYSNNSLIYIAELQSEFGGDGADYLLESSKAYALKQASIDFANKIREYESTEPFSVVIFYFEKEADFPDLEYIYGYADVIDQIYDGPHSSWRFQYMSAFSGEDIWVDCDGSSKEKCKPK